MRTTTDGGSLGYELLMRRVMTRQVSAEPAVALSAAGVQVSMMQSGEYRLSVASRLATPLKVSLDCEIATL